MKYFEGSDDIPTNRVPPSKEVPEEGRIFEKLARPDRECDWSLSPMYCSSFV